MKLVLFAIISLTAYILVSIVSFYNIWSDGGGRILRTEGVEQIYAASMIIER